MKREILISYAREDIKIAKTLLEQLFTEGYLVWWDQSIHAGTKWTEELDQKLVSVDSIIVLWSKFSIVSNFVIKEAEIAQQRNALIPLLLEDCEIPNGIGDTQAIDFRHWHSTTNEECFQQLKYYISLSFGGREYEEFEQANLHEMRQNLEANPHLKEEVLQRSHSGDAEYQFYMGQVYRLGIWGFEKSLQQAIPWLETAAQQNEFNSARALAFIYRLEVTPPNYAACLKWAEHGSMLGEPDCAMLAGGLYSVGYPGVNKNKILAKRYYQHALQLGHHNAQKELDNLG